MPDDAYGKKAKLIWEAMDQNERTGVRFGMFPAVKMASAEAEGYQRKELCVSLMHLAHNNGGMRA